MNSMKLFLIIFSTLILTSCASYKHRQLICDGLLQSGIGADSFRDIWGLPTRTKIVSGAEMMSANIGRFGGGFFKGKATYQQWIYEDRGVTLAFYSRKMRLAGWNTNKTVKELASPNLDACK